MVQKKKLEYEVAGQVVVLNSHCIQRYKSLAIIYHIVADPAHTMVWLIFFARANYDEEKMSKCEAPRGGYTFEGGGVIYI
jgi:hypothetical protein